MKSPPSAPQQCQVSIQHDLLEELVYPRVLVFLLNKHHLYSYLDKGVFRSVISNSVCGCGFISFND